MRLINYELKPYPHLDINNIDSWDMIAAIREIVRLMSKEYASGVLHLEETVSLVTSELMENAYKYSPNKTGNLTFTLNTDSQEINIYVYNKVSDVNIANDVVTRIRNVNSLQSIEDISKAMQDVTIKNISKGSSKSECGLLYMRLHNMTAKLQASFITKHEDCIVCIHYNIKY